MSSVLDDVWGLDSGAWAVRVEVSTADGMEEESLHLFGSLGGEVAGESFCGEEKHV